MTDRYWKAPVSAAWNDPNSWTPTGVPATVPAYPPGTFSPIDNVFFDTGSNVPYTVTQGAGPDPEALNVTISHDHVLFDHFEFLGAGNQKILVENGAVATFDSTSNITGEFFNLWVNVDVEGATLSVEGSATTNSLTVGTEGTLTVANPGFSWTVFGGILVAQGGNLVVSNGGTLIGGLDSASAGRITISGAGSTLNTDALSPYAGPISVSNGGTLDAQGLSYGGHLVLTGGTASLLEIAQGATAVGHGALNLIASPFSEAANNGLIEATGGSLRAAADIITGSGSLAVGSLATLDITQSNEDVAFKGFGGSLQVEGLNGETGVIRGFGFGDSFHVGPATSFTTAPNGANTTLDVFNAGSLVQQFNIAGQLSASDLVSYSDGKGGTFITDILPPVPGLSGAVSALERGINAGHGPSALQDFLQSLRYNPLLVAHSS